MTKDKVSVVRSSWSDLSPSILELLEAKVLSVEAALRRRRAGVWSDEDLDVLFLHYLMGVVMSVMPDAAPQGQLGLLRRLAANALKKEQLDAAVYRRVQVANQEMLAAFNAAQLMGNRDAIATLIQFDH